jgi:hypothetical protein
MVRSKGYWIVGGKRLVNRVIHQCLKCKKLRGKLYHQKMADLPSERITPSPPFTYVGLDVFGHGKSQLVAPEEDTLTVNDGQ